MVILRPFSVWCYTFLSWFSLYNINDILKYHSGKEVPYINEEKLLKILETCKQESSYSLLIRTLGEVYSSADSLSQSFIKQHPDSPLDAMLDKAPKDLKNLKKEDVRIMEGDLDKDEDSQEVSEEGGECSQGSRSWNTTSMLDDVRVDIPSLRRAYKALFEVPGSVFESPLVHALITLSGNLELDLRLFGRGRRDNAEELLNVFVIVLEIPTLGSSEYLEMALPQVCKAASHLPVRLQARLARIWARHCRSRLKGLLEALQQLITLKVISGQFSRDYCVQDEESITAPTKLMKVNNSIINWNEYIDITIFLKVYNFSILILYSSSSSSSTTASTTEAF